MGFSVVGAGVGMSVKLMLQKALIFDHSTLLLQLAAHGEAETDAVWESEGRRDVGEGEGSRRDVGKEGDGAGIGKLESIGAGMVLLLLVLGTTVSARILSPIIEIRKINLIQIHSPRMPAGLPSLLEARNMPQRIFVVGGGYMYGCTRKISLRNAKTIEIPSALGN